MNVRLTLLFIIITLPICAHAQDASDTITTQTIGEVVVKGERPQVKSENGAMIVDLPSIVKDKPVTNILEALAYLPGAISQNGVISIAGTGQTAIVINGEASQMSLQQMYQLLYSMPVSRLKQVEVMYSAPAKYHVNGAVINVILKAPTALDGLQGQARAGYDQGHYASFDGGLALLYATKRWTFETNYSLAKNKTWHSEDMTSWHTLSNGLHVIEEQDRQTASNLSNTTYGAIGYKINENSSIRATYNGQYIGHISADTRSCGSLGTFSNSSAFGKPKMLHNVNINYKSDFGLTLSADYLSYDENREQTLRVTNGKWKMENGECASDFSIFNFQFSIRNSTLVNSINKQRINRYRFTADMQHNVKGWGIDYGIDYKLTDDHSSMEYLMPDYPGLDNFGCTRHSSSELGSPSFARTFSNTLNEHTLKAYVGLAHKFSWGLSFQASLAEELYRTQGNSNWTFLPQFAMTYYKTPTHILQASFNANRTFPSYWTLHGGVGYLNPYIEVWGNPDLKPSTEYSAQVSYIFNRKYVATLFYKNVADCAAQLPYQSPSELKLIFQEQNFDYDRKTGISLVAPFTVCNWLDTRLTAQGYYQAVRASHFHDIGFTRGKLCFYGSVQNTFKIARRLALTFDASGLSGALQGIADLSGIWRIDAGAKWSLGKDNCMELNIKADDIFNRWSPVMRINHETQDYRMAVGDMTRHVKLSFVYRFNGFKPKNTSVDTSRLGTK